MTDYAYLVPFTSLAFFSISLYVTLRVERPKTAVEYLDAIPASIFPGIAIFAVVLLSIGFFELMVEASNTSVPAWAVGPFEYVMLYGAVGALVLNLLVLLVSLMLRGLFEKLIPWKRRTETEEEEAPPPAPPPEEKRRTKRVVVVFKTK